MRRPPAVPSPARAMLGQGAFSPGLVPLGELSAGPLPQLLAPPGDLSGKVDDMHGKIRKPYTITKQRENWTEQEHNKFLKALELFDRDWRKIEEYVGTKTVIQIRSHAQKYFLKVQKSGQDAHVPPPRPKRKSSQPYPQKASKVVAAAQAAQQAAASSGKAFSPREGPYAPGGLHPAVPPQSPQEEAGTLAASAWGGEAPSKANPDFAKVYRFLGDVFEIGVAGNLQKLKVMPPIDRETIILLMRNLAINLASPVFAEQQHILALADSSARSQQLDEQAQPRMIDQEPQSQSAPPTPSDTSTTPGSQGELVPSGASFLESPRYRDGLPQQSPLFEQDGRGGARVRGFADGVPLGLGLGLGMSHNPQRDVQGGSREQGGNAEGFGD